LEVSRIQADAQVGQAESFIYIIKEMLAVPTGATGGADGCAAGGAGGRLVEG